MIFYSTLQSLALVPLMLISLNTQAASDMPLAFNLYEDGQQALQQNIPIAILLSFKGLKATENLKEEALYPSLVSGIFDGKVIFREVEVNVPGTLIDFYNEPLEVSEFQALYNITSLPALIFVKGDGEEISPALFSGSYDFYGFYLKRQLDQAMEALGNPSRFSEP